jgi:hypothetical protein
MTYRRCRNPHRTDGPTLEQIITLAIEKLGWNRKKVMSWVEKENASLKHARPRELVDRGQGELVIDLLNKRESDRLKEDKRRKEK